MILECVPTIPDYMRVDMRKELGSKLSDAVFEKAPDFTEVGKTCKWAHDGRQLYAFYFEGNMPPSHFLRLGCISWGISLGLRF